MKTSKWALLKRYPDDKFVIEKIYQNLDEMLRCRISGIGRFVVAPLKPGVENKQILDVDDFDFKRVDWQEGHEINKL